MTGKMYILNPNSIAINIIVTTTKVTIATTITIIVKTYLTSSTTMENKVK